MCRALRCTYQELMGLPEEIYDYFSAFVAGEARATKERAAQAAAAGGAAG